MMKQEDVDREFLKIRIGLAQERLAALQRRIDNIRERTSQGAQAQR